VNTTDILSIANAICPDRDMMVFEGKRVIFSQVNDRTNKLANALMKLGIEKGDRIGVLQVNCNEYIEAYFAAAKLGAIFVPLNFRAKEDELSYMVSNAEAKLIFLGTRYLEMFDQMLPVLQTIKDVIMLDGASDRYLGYEDLVGSSSPEEVLGDIEDEDITILMYTAGTTGRPKGVPLTHNGFVSYILDNVEPASPEIEERNLITMPLYHVAGIQAMLAAVYGGRTMILMRQFEVKEWMRTVQDEGATRAMLVPTMLKWVIDDPDFSNFDLSSLKVITYGAAPMPLEAIKKAIHEMPWVRFINAFGQTETASTITSLGPEDHVIDGSEEEREKKLKRLTSSIGRPLPDVEVKVVDNEGNLLKTGEAGNIMAKGPRIMSGYWRDAEKTAQTFTDDGWLKTGDVGWMDEEGYIYLSGRGDDMIIRGGENISPEEVEGVLHSHPKIDEAAVIGVPDPDWGQEPMAVVVLNKDEMMDPEEIMEYCRSQLAGFKRPRSVVFVESLPRNPMGKVLRRKLREQYGQP
jgi:acyl-CoA synthetase (AMP-forming)/AMP-acid ligase II